MKWLYRFLIVVGIVLVFSPVAAETYTYYQQGILNSKLMADAGQVDEEDPTVVYPEELTTVEGFSENSREELQVSKPVKEEPINAPFKLTIPKIKLDAVVVDGVGKQDLRKGPGLYPQGSLPGAPGNVAIAAHRTTYGAWFNHLDRLGSGDEITISREGRDIIYQVEKVFTTTKDDWSVIEPMGYNTLTLTTCDPPGSVKRRLIVRARQEAEGDGD
ncbi:class E sortase [Metallumcola ferriviriculae]|uniref:Class E sortase n=1 Tax=Metallumcola ferriviriculae TaxID=3039180 RepID=A0AAU0URA0_9FIRM|nr:class E sortase [Desulfitibacteraceae bacterium MK1]